MEAEQYTLDRWSLADLYPGPEAPEVAAAMEDLEGRVRRLESMRPALSETMDPAQLVRILDEYDAFLRQLSRLHGFATLRFNEDTQDAQAQTFLARMEQLAAESDNRTLFLKLWWKSLPDEPAARLMEKAGEYRYWLEALRLERPHTLSEPEEKIVNLKNVNGPLALIRLYDSIVNRYTYRLEVDGAVKELNREELQVYLRDPRAELREAAYRELHRVYSQDANVLGQIFQARMRDWRSEYVDLRRHRSPISARNLMNDLPDDVVDTLLEVCRENAPLFQRYFRLKARWLGVDRLRRYDIYAPLAKTEKTYSYQDSIRLVRESLASFDERLVSLMLRVFDERHVDSEIRRGKSSGAFCLSIEPALTPWVLMSYKGRAEDIFTMAHELGHALHGLLAQEHSLLTYQPSLPLAETASTFSEMLLVDHFLEQDPDPAVQRDLLFRQADDAYATIGRQAYFALFERAAHDVIPQGASPDDLSKIYMDNLQEQFGDALDLTEDFRIEWLEILHFIHYPFYVYAYAFGQLLVFSLYDQYQREGEPFKPRFLEILSAGGSDSPERILARAGFDIHSADFWRGGFRVLGSMLERLEAIPRTG